MGEVEIRAAHKELETVLTSYSEEEKYRTSLTKFDAEGLPDDAGYGMHEDYIMWHHWIEAVEETRKRIASLQEIAEEGLYAGDILDAGY